MKSARINPAFAPISISPTSEGKNPQRTKTDESVPKNIIDGRDLVGGRRIISTDFFTEKMLPLAHPSIPRFSVKPSTTPEEICFGGVIMPIEQPSGGFVVSREAEIKLDDWELIATVKKKDGKHIVVFEDSPPLIKHNIHQKDFNEVIKNAIKWIDGDF